MTWNNSGNKWQAAPRLGGKLRYLGFFAEEAEAAEAVAAARTAHAEGRLEAHLAGMWKRSKV